MSTFKVLLVAMCLVFSTSASSECDCPGHFEAPVTIAMYAEGYTLDLVSGLPGPLPYPKAYKDLLEIADDYQQIGLETMSLRGIYQRADLPGPMPMPKKAVMPLPPPQTLIKQAVQLQRHTLWLLEELDTKIENAYERGAMTNDSYFDLLGVQAVLHERIRSLPGPMPIPG